MNYIEWLEKCILNDDRKFVWKLSLGKLDSNMKSVQVQVLCTIYFT